MRRGFTLLELMIVMGIMAFLGLAGANGYNALKRGMAERSAVDAASAFLRAAKERALVDRMPVAVFCWNRCMREATEDDNAIVVGEAVAIRRAGRITKVNGDMLYDEFGDLDRSYDTDDDASDIKARGGLRLWYMPDDGTVPDMEYSIVSDGVYENDNAGGLSYTPQAGSVSDDPNLTGTGNNRGDGKTAELKIKAYAFCIIGGNFSGWTAGTAYGLEFQRLTLPDGFIFGSSIPSQQGDIVKDSKMLLKPDVNNNESVVISRCQMGADGKPANPRKVGTASCRKK